MKNVKEIKVSSIEELKEVLDGIAEDVIAQIEEDKKRVHTPFHITLDDIFNASAKVMAAEDNDLEWDEIKLIAKHVSEVAHIIEEKFIPVPDEDPEEEEKPKEEKLPGYKRRLKIEYRQLKRRYERLHKMINKYDAGTLEFELNCPIELLKRQKKTMGEYLNCLEIRAEIENVTLEEE